MGRFTTVVLAAGCAVLITAPARAQFGRGNGDWSTSGADAQRSGWVRNDPKISPESMQKPGFSFIWKVKLAGGSAWPNTFVGTPALLDRYIGYRGFRTFAFIGGGANQVSAMDVDLGRIEWQKSIGPKPAAGTGACPGGMTANVARPVNPAFPAAAQAGRGFGFRGGAAKGDVGAPGEGAVTIQEVAAREAAAGRGGRGPAGRGYGAGFRRMPIDLYAVSSDGLFHSMYVSNGEEPEKAVPFLPANANAEGLIVLDGVVYAATTQGCGGAPNAVWALDTESKKVASWKPVSGDIAGTAGPAIAPDGTLYVTTTGGDLVALQAKTLEVKNVYSAKAEFTSSPVLFQAAGKTMVAAATKDGRIHVLDIADLSKPLGTPRAATGSGFAPGALTTWEDAKRTRWILAPSGSAIAAWKLAVKNGSAELQPAWTTRQITAPMDPMVVNGVVFALAAGGRSTPAVLYALDGDTGKESWNSGKTMTSYAQGGIAGGGSQIYVATHDGTFYAFGFGIEH